jgi:hypothetical protein
LTPKRFGVDQQTDRNIEQFHVAEELRFAGRMQNLFSAEGA